MAGKLSNYAVGLAMDCVFGKISNPFPSTLYFALSTTTPANDGTGVTEPSGGSYARVSVTNDSTNFPATGTDRSKANGAVITYPTATGNWGTCTHFVVFDASSSGNMIAWGVLSSPITVTTGVQPEFAVGGLTIVSPSA